MLNPFSHCVLHPRVTRNFSSNSTYQFCLFLNVIQMESYHMYSIGVWLFSLNIFLEGGIGETFTHVLHIVVDYSYCYLLGKYIA